MGQLAGNPENDVSVVASRGKEFAFGRPADDIDGLIMLGEGREVFNLAIGAVRVDFPDANVVITTSSSETTLAAGLKVSRVDGGVLLVPIDDERRGLHPDEGMLRQLCRG